MPLPYDTILLKYVVDELVVASLLHPFARQHVIELCSLLLTLKNAVFGLEL
jgi:hypothetical protein